MQEKPCISQWKKWHFWKSSTTVLTTS